MSIFIALISTAVALGGALAHVLELPNKLNLSRDHYFIVQSIYAGWNRLAYLLILQFLSILMVITISRHESMVLWPTVIALAGLIAAQAVFWLFTYPANVATNNWTTIPENWEALRHQWEYSHAAGAIFQLVSMCALAISALAHNR